MERPSYGLSPGNTVDVTSKTGQEGKKDGSLMYNLRTGATVANESRYGSLAGFVIRLVPKTSR